MNDLSVVVVWWCVSAGSAIIVFGFILGAIDIAARIRLSEKIKQLPGPGDPSQGYTTAPDLTEMIKALGELAKALVGLPQAVQSFFVAVLLFAFATALAFASQLT